MVAGRGVDWPSRRVLTTLLDNRLPPISVSLDTPDRQGSCGCRLKPQARPPCDPTGRPITQPAHPVHVSCGVRWRRRSPGRRDAHHDPSSRLAVASRLTTLARVISPVGVVVCGWPKTIVPDSEAARQSKACLLVPPRGRLLRIGSESRTRISLRIRLCNAGGSGSDLPNLHTDQCRQAGRTLVGRRLSAACPVLAPVPSPTAGPVVAVARHDRPAEPSGETVATTPDHPSRQDGQSGWVATSVLARTCRSAGPIAMGWCGSKRSGWSPAPSVRPSRQTAITVRLCRTRPEMNSHPMRTDCFDGLAAIGGQGIGQLGLLQSPTAPVSWSAWSGWA